MKEVSYLQLPVTDYKSIKKIIDHIEQVNLNEKEEEALLVTLKSKDGGLRDIKKIVGINDSTLLPTNPIEVSENSDAVAMFNADLNLGVFQTVKLIHSGFSITYRPITDDQFIGLDTRLALETINLGRSTNGLLYSNLSAGLVKLLVDFIVPSIHKTTLQLDKKDNIMEYIKIQDFEYLLLGIIKSRYQNGIAITKGCVNNAVLVEGKPKCTHTVTGTLNTTLLSYIDHDLVTDEMLLFMAKDTVSKKEILFYQNNLPQNKPKVYSLNINDKEFKVTLKASSVKDYIALGDYWINKVIKKTEKLLNDKITESAKIDMINAQAKQYYLGTYLHLFNSITSSTVTLTKIIDINRALNSLSGNPHSYDAIIDIIDEFKNQVSITRVGLPTYTCTECKNTQTKDDKLIPLDMVKTFFDLTSLHTGQILQRG